MKFPYPRQHFFIRFMALTTMLALAIYMLWTPTLPEMAAIRLAGFGAICFLAIGILTLTPLFTSHEMNDIGIHLRNGLNFNISIRFEDIASVEEIGSRPWTFGLLPSASRGRVILANGNRNLVSIKLSASRRFRSLLGRSFDEIIIDLVNPDEFVKMANKKLQR
jgi:hypothetical protein